jgi:prepilin-type N-terminal cleavage/methylation domain-containing protein
MKFRNAARQSGFTLVEIAIVLVIIGILLVGVLQGQEMIQNARIKTAKAGLDGVSNAYKAYVDRFNRIPGDDGNTAAMVARGANWANVVGGNSDGYLTVTAANTFNTAAGESGALWGQLRAAGFLQTGDMSSAALAALSPLNPWGGRYGITPIVGAAGTTLGFPDTKVCMSHVPGTAARGLDSQFDDGNPATGFTRATLNATVLPAAGTAPGVAAAAYVDENTYTVCSRL